MSAPIVFLDTETDGIHPYRKVWEVAMIRRHDGFEREIQFYVEIDLADADPFGLKVGRFYERHPLGCELSGAIAPRPRHIPEGMTWARVSVPPESEAAAARLVAQWTHGAHIVGAVPNFDTEVLGRLLRDQGLTPAWHYHLIDVEALAVGYLAGRWAQAAADGNATEPGPFDPGLPWDSDTLSAALDVSSPTDDRHTALGDARWAQRIYDAVMSGGAP